MKREPANRGIASSKRLLRRSSLRHAAISRFSAFAGLAIAFMLFPRQPAAAQSRDPQVNQQAQTIHIPVSVFQADTTPSAGLKDSNFRLLVDDKPRSFTLGKPEVNSSVSAGPGATDASGVLNLLIILPFGNPENRSKVLKEAAQVFSQMPSGTDGTQAVWNVSILDDSGQQNRYTKNLKEIAGDLEQIRHQEPQETDWNAWRLAEWQAIASMKTLPGRRAVLSLGDLFHVELHDSNGFESSEYMIPGIASAARDAGAVIYAADTAGHILRDKRVQAQYRILGSGPWMLVSPDNVLEGWITKSVAATISQITSDGKASYGLDLHLGPKEMDSSLHKISVQVVNDGAAVLSAPTFYVSPNPQQLALLAKAPALLRNAMSNPPPDSPLQLAVELSYFPHANGKIGTQVMTTGLYWLKSSRPPPRVAILLQLLQTDLGFSEETSLTERDWISQPLLWSANADLAPGAYLLRVSAAGPAGEAIGATSYPFSVARAGEEPLLISSLVLGGGCIFHPLAHAGDQEERESSSPAAGRDKPLPQAQQIDYLQAGQCVLQPNPSAAYSPDDIVWTLVRMTPTGKLTAGSPKDWKSSFTIVNEKGSRKAESSIQWIAQPDHSLVATAAFPLGNLKLADGQYAVIFSLSGPGVENGGFEENAPFTVEGGADGSKKRR